MVLILPSTILVRSQVQAGVEILAVHDLGQAEGFGRARGTESLHD